MADDNNPPGDDEQDPQEPPAPAGDDVEAMRKALAKANDEAKRYRLKAKELEPLAAKAKELEDAGKTEMEKLNGRLTDAEQRAQAAEERALRLEVASAKGLTPTQAKRLVGSTREELEADADEILAEFTPQRGGGDDDTRRRPREALRSGAAPEADDEIDIASVVSKVSRF